MEIGTYTLVTVLTGYLLGSLQPSYLLGRTVKKIDIRDFGSNNTGASNTTIVLGLKYGVIVGAIDIMKGLLAVILARYVISSGTQAAYLGGMSAVLGHMFPFYLGFRGGKGLATVIGFMGGISFLWAVCASAVLIGVAFATDYIVLGTVSFVIFFAVYTVCRFGAVSYECLFMAVACLLILLKHRRNYSQIIHGTEPRMSAIFGKKK